MRGIGQGTYGDGDELPGATERYLGPGSVEIPEHVVSLNEVPDR